eukprot:TRINITY_DN78188_c0_g1_i1.p1 TRINITY_DN78188_c0_g1~~TRINITY_DN78188_c0_g1_i1.p1  ORF type:complete len:198 (+),score=53.16 TRINITY_DN78188_c0_g1_i1:105-698(+)
MIQQTIEKIDFVANASKEQERGITQINDAVNTLDQATQKNAQVADEISRMSGEIADMSNSLVTAASRASFLEEAREEVANVDLVYDTAKLKVNVLNIKDGVYSKLGSYDNWTALGSQELDKWISDYIEINPNVNFAAIENLKELNKNLTVKLQALIDANASKESNEVLNDKAKEIEIESLRIFGTLNSLKKEACQNQ